MSADLPGSESELSDVWRRESAEYVSAINQFVERGMHDGWENAGEQPEDPRGRLATSVLEMVRRANAVRDTATLRDRFPPAHSPFIDLLDDNGQSLEPVVLLDDGRIVIRIGAPYERGNVVVIDGDECTEVSDVLTFGRDPTRRYFAVALSDGVLIRDQWEGPVVSKLPWPTGLEGIPSGYDVKPWSELPIITRLIPFPDGKRALLASPEGIFVLEETAAIRLLPTAAQFTEHFNWLRKEHPEDELWLGLSMDHGAISHDGTLIAVGSQDSKHLIFNDRYKLVGSIGHLSEYPHYSEFSADDSIVLLNSCHFYNGVSIGVPTQLLPGLETEPYNQDERFPILEDGARVYAAVVSDDQFIVGDAGGYLRCFDLTGEFRWQHHIGSSVGDIDISADGKRLVASTYAGFLSIIDLDTGEADPYQIGTATHRERRRWLFWKQEPRPLIW